LSLQDTVVVSLFLYRSTTSFVSIPNNHSLLRISTLMMKVIMVSTILIMIKNPNPPPSGLCLVHAVVFWSSNLPL
jgi:hypothetical protein